uniref:OmpH family outer membrane protein n=1 Tax=Thaumasiovibrio occultus TaxID=1891184 RepID=UPI000B350437|nr:OmpH family outer membrane protein [Thaumasiovibrio occultus]
MKKWIKATGLGLLLSTASYATHAAQNIGVVVVPAVMQHLAEANNVQGRMEAEFKDRVNALRSIEQKGKEKLEQLQRDGELMSDEDRRSLQREIAQLESEFKLSAQALREDQATRSREEEQKLVSQLQEAIDSVAEAGGYDIILDGSAVAFAKEEHNLTQKVIDAL